LTEIGDGRSTGRSQQVKCFLASISKLIYDMESWAFLLVNQRKESLNCF